MNSNFEHFILTQFNVYMRWSKCIPERDLRKPLSSELPTYEWFKHRLDLFDRYCYPSIAGQTNQNFKWFVLFDEEHTDKKLLEKYDKMIPIYIDSENYTKYMMYQWFSKKIKEYLNPKTEWLITSKIDCDDALSKNYVKIMQEKFTPKEHMINPARGVIYNLTSKNLLSLNYNRPPNPFITIIEKLTVGDLKTCFKIVHWKMHNYFKNYENMITKDPLWLQTIHDKNLNNKFRGNSVENIDQALDIFCMKR